MKLEQVQMTQTRRERSERCSTLTPENTASATSFFFHLVAQIHVFTLLLSSFTHTRVYARAYARESAREGGVGKEVKRFGPPMRAYDARVPRSSTMASVATEMNGMRLRSRVTAATPLKCTSCVDAQACCLGRYEDQQFS